MSRPYLRERDRSGYFSEDTIAAIATALGGPITIVRISGPGAFEALAGLLGRSADRFEPRRLHRARLLSTDGSPLDDALAVRFIAPDSFTGEDIVELHLHGSSFLANEVLESLFRAGVRQALPGEFSFRAVRNGKLTLPQAQAAADLIASSNQSAVQLALEKMSGTQNRLLAGISSDLRRLAALAEVGIDFSDQDVEEVSLPALKGRLSPLLQSLLHLHASYDRGIRIQDGVSVAFIGLPNAGKSSFFNSLLGEDRALVSEVAGTTRDVLRERLTLKGKSLTVTLRLEDTAGLRVASDRIEEMGIDRARRSAREADLVLFLLDATQEMGPASEQWHHLGTPCHKALGILTKCDLIPEDRMPAVLAAKERFGISHWIPTSARTGAGIPETIQAITEFCSRWIRRDRDEVVLTRLDHAQAVGAALGHLERARSTPEVAFFAADLKQALHALAPLIGETPSDDILGQIFSDFCIGK
ncbi:MAG: tRNA uridine-5-carboxymethylaminomethyl(34) synthesis GTPase MnmE [Oligoflexia bacterium]|nr:tRNA uridine-5-carboxymethylaminomethyl(34) synthesis GTPase MnmE [Oligoflexia bacterium]